MADQPDQATINACTLHASSRRAKLADTHPLYASAEVFHEHDVAAAVVLLRIQNPSPVGRQSDPRFIRDGSSVQRRNMHHPFLGKAQKLERGLRLSLGVHKVNARFSQSPVAPK